MRSAMQSYGLIDSSLLSTKDKIEWILESVPDREHEQPLWSCHAVCRALYSMRHRLHLFDGYDVLVQDGHFHRVGCNHSWLLLTNKQTFGLLICDPAPMGGHGVVFSAQDSVLAPWYGLYIEDATKYGSRLTDFEEEAVALETAIKNMIDAAIAARDAESIPA